jgi:hypothetical protein
VLFAVPFWPDGGVAESLPDGGAVVVDDGAVLVGPGP